jgi:hypothetical protein
MRRLLPRLNALVLGALLAGCGTNVEWLLAEDGRLTSEADRIIIMAEEAAPGLEEPVYAAEDSKQRACRFLHEAVMDRIERTPSFGEAFVSDLSALVALFVPLGPVERCAHAMEAYRTAIAGLEQQLIEVGGMAGTPEPAPPADRDSS